MHQRALPVRHRSRISLPMYCLQPTYQENDSIHQSTKKKSSLEYSSTHHTSRNASLPPARVQQSDILESLLWSPEGSEPRESSHPRDDPAIATFSLPSKVFHEATATATHLRVSRQPTRVATWSGILHNLAKKVPARPVIIIFAALATVRLLENRLFWKAPKKRRAAADTRVVVSCESCCGTYRDTAVTAAAAAV